MVDINITLVFQVINFLVLYWLLDLVMFKPILRVMDERNRRMINFGEGFADERAELNELESVYRKKLSEIHSEVAQIRREAKDQGNSEKAEILNRAEAQAEKLYAEKTNIIDSNLDQLGGQLTEDVPQLSKALNDKIYG